MNLHDRYSPSHLSKNQMEQSLLRLFEIYQQLDKDLLGESLISGRMSNFLFEADQEEIVVNTAEEARDATMQNLDVMEGVGEKLNKSQAIATFVLELRKRLTKIILDTSTFASLKDFAGITIKQISFIGNSLVKGIKSIDGAIDAVVSSLNTLKIDYKSPEKAEKTLKELIDQSAQGLNPDMDSNKFRKAIQDKMAEISGEGVKGVFSKVMDMIKGASNKSITMNGAQFADELLGCTGKQIDEYLNGPAPKLANDETPPAGDVVKQLAADAKVTSADVESAKPAGTKASKFTNDEWAKVHREVGTKPDDLKAALNKRSQALFNQDLIEAKNRLNRGVASSNVLLERWEKLAGINGSKG